MHHSAGEIIWPNLFLIGVPRAGTTALYTYLQQHPGVFMTPAKEPGFFAVDGALYDLECRHAPQTSYFLTTIDAYQALFRHLGDETVIGDATPHYFYHRRVAQRIAYYAPDAKILSMLRSPAERMYSHYMMEVRDGSQRRTFERFLREIQGMHANHPALQNSYYFDHLKQYYTLIKPEQIKTCLYDELRADPPGLMKTLYRWLNIDDSFVPDISGQPNRSGIPKSRLHHRLVMKSLDHRLMRYVHLYGPKNLGLHLEAFRNRYFDRNLVPQSLPREAEIALNRERFRDDILKLQDLIGRDLSHWLG